MNEFTICEKRVDNQGDTYWAFSNSIMMCDDKPPEKETNENHMCTIKPSPGKGFGLFAKNNEIPSGTNLFSEKSYACLPIGKHRARVCMNCLKFGHKKVKVSSDCSDIFFCSHECLNAMDDFTTLCGPLITQLFVMKKDVEDHQDLLLFTVLILYKRYTCLASGRSYLPWQQLMKQNGHTSTKLPIVMNVSRLLHNLLVSLAPVLLQPAENVATVDLILRILQYNSQSFSIPELPSTSLMCHFGSLSKVNHSCVPNTILTISLHPTSITDTSESSELLSPKVSASIVTIRDVQPGEELCMSYLSQLCTIVEDRRSLLQQGFLFACNCPRCCMEQTILSKTIVKGSSIAPQLAFLDNANYHPSLVDRVKLSKSVADKVNVIKEHYACTNDALQHLKTIQRKISKSNSSPSSNVNLNKTIVENMYKIHETAMCIFDIHLGTKVLANSYNDIIEWDCLSIWLVDLLVQCWELSFSCLQYYQISFIMIAASSAVRLLSNCSGDASKHDSTLKMSLRLSERGLVKLNLFMTACKNDIESSDTCATVKLYDNTKKKLLECIKMIRMTV